MNMMKKSFFMLNFIILHMFISAHTINSWTDVNIQNNEIQLEKGLPRHMHYTSIYIQAMRIIMPWAILFHFSIYVYKILHTDKKMARKGVRHAGTINSSKIAAAPVTQTGQIIWLLYNVHALTKQTKKTFPQIQLLFLAKLDEYS